MNDLIAPKITAMVNQLLLLSAEAHGWHLKTKSYAQHMAFGELYDYAHDAADSLSEAAQGAGYQPPLTGPAISCSFSAPAKAIPEIERLCGELSKLSDQSASVPWFANLVQEVEGNLYKIAYKLKRLG